MVESAVVCVVATDCLLIVLSVLVDISFTCCAVSITVRVRVVRVSSWRIVKIKIVNIITVSYGWLGSAEVNAFHTLFESVVKFRVMGVDSIFHVGELKVCIPPNVVYIVLVHL